MDHETNIASLTPISNAFYLIRRPIFILFHSRKSLFLLHPLGLFTEDSCVGNGGPRSLCSAAGRGEAWTEITGVHPTSYTPLLPPLLGGY